MKKLPKGVGENIGPFYVYLIINPKTGMPFYVGKGTGERLLKHGIEAELNTDARDQPEKVKLVRQLLSEGLEPQIDVLRYGIETNEEALRIEASVIDAYSGVVTLTNRIRGHMVDKGRELLTELVFRYAATPLTSHNSMLLITLGKWQEDNEPIEGNPRTGYGWYSGMTPDIFYNSNRGWWEVTSNKDLQPQHVAFVAEGIIRGIWSVDEWLPGEGRETGRWAFRGDYISRGVLFDEFVGKSVMKKKGARKPIMYWPKRKNS